MREFEKYSEEMENFRQGKLYAIYPEIVSYLESTTSYMKSSQLEFRFGITGAEVRGVVQYARRQGLAVASGGPGYRMARTKDELEGTLGHLRERRDSLSYTINQLKKAFLVDAQTVEHDSGGVSMNEFFEFEGMR